MTVTFFCAMTAPSVHRKKAALHTLAVARRVLRCRRCRAVRIAAAAAVVLTALAREVGFIALHLPGRKATDVVDITTRAHLHHAALACCCPSPDRLESDVNGQLNHVGNPSATLVQGSAEGNFRIARNARRKMTARHLCQTYTPQCVLPRCCRSPCHDQPSHHRRPYWRTGSVLAEPNRGAA